MADAHIHVAAENEVKPLHLSPFVTLRLFAGSQDEGIVCENYLLHQEILMTGSGALAAFDYMRTPHQTDELLQGLAHLLDMPEHETKILIDEMLAIGILVKVTDKQVGAAEAMREVWIKAGWDAAFYLHLASRDYPFIDYAFGRTPDYELMRQYMQVQPVPEKYKYYPDVPTLPLHKPEEHLPVAANLAHIFDLLPPVCHTEQLDVQLLGDLLYFVVGQIGVKPWPEQGLFVRRTSPSGGARHPTEAYVVVLDIPDLPSGIYHYNVREHGLDCIESCDDVVSLYERICQAAPDIANRVRFRPAVVLFFSSIVERSMWRYRESRSYRPILIDVGHLLGTFRCAALALGLEAFVGQGVHEDQAEILLKLDGIEEGVLFVGAVGTVTDGGSAHVAY